jgi:hypothetical protein
VKLLNRVLLLNRTANPSSPPAGELWYRSDTQQAWIQGASTPKLLTISPTPWYHAPIPTSSRWWPTQLGATSTQAMTLNRLYYMPLAIPATKTLSKVLIEVTTLAASGTARFGLYNGSLTTCLPTTKIYEDTSTFSTASTGLKTLTMSTAQTITADTLYFLALDCQVAAPTLRSFTSRDPYVSDTHATVPTTASNANAYFETQSGAMPANATIAVNAIGVSGCIWAWFN